MPEKFSGSPPVTLDRTEALDSLGTSSKRFLAVFVLFLANDTISFPRFAWERSWSTLRVADRDAKRPSSAFRREASEREPCFFEVYEGDAQNRLALAPPGGTAGLPGTDPLLLMCVANDHPTWTGPWKPGVPTEALGSLAVRGSIVRQGFGSYGCCEKPQPAYTD